MARLCLGVASALAVAGCGRIAFDPRSDGALSDPPIIAPAFDYSKVVTGPTGQVITCVTATGSDGFVIAGRTTTMLDFGSGPHTYLGGEDVFLASYAADGTYRWSRMFGSTVSDDPFDLASDAQGNVYVTGVVGGSTDFGGGVHATGAEDIYVASYTPTGAYRWSRVIGSTSSSEIGFGLATSSDSLYITGWFSGTTDFGDGVRTPADPQQDVFLLVTDFAGNTRFSNHFGSVMIDQGQKIAVGSDGRIAIGGLFAGATNFGSGDIPSAGSHDAFVVLTDPAGVPVWSHTAGQANSDRGSGIAIGPDGEVYLCGEHHDRFELGGVGTTSQGIEDGYLMRFAADGTPTWVRGIAGSMTDRAVNCVMAPDRSIITNIITSSPTLMLGDVAITTSGLTDGVFAAYDREGALAWHVHVGGAGTEAVRDVAVDPTGAIYAAGSFDSTINFGDGQRTPNGTDGFVMRYRPIN